MAWVSAPKKLLVPDASASPMIHGQILIQWRGSEMFIHFMRALEQFFEAIHADGDSDGHAGWQTIRSSVPRPSPEFNMLLGSMPNLVTASYWWKSQ